MLSSKISFCDTTEFRLNRKLGDAIRLGNVGEIDSLIKRRASLNYGLDCACKVGRLDLVKLMVRMGAKYFLSAFSIACAHANYEIMNFLIESANGERNMWNLWNFGLEGACMGGHRIIVDVMILKGASDWNMGLLGACRRGKREMVDLMIAKGANNFKEALVGACEGGNRDIVDLIISKLTDYENVLNDAMFSACNVGNRDLVEFMIEKGATDFENALNIACKQGYCELAEFLIVEKNVDYFRKALEYACDYGRRDVVELLIRYGESNWKAKGTNYEKSIWNSGFAGACWGGNQYLFDLTVANGANDWEEGLQWAIRGKRIHIVKSIIEKSRKPLWNFGLRSAFVNDFMSAIPLFICQSDVLSLTCLSKEKMLLFLAYVCGIPNFEKRRQWCIAFLNNTTGFIISYVINRRLLRARRENPPLFNIVREFCCKDVATFGVAMSSI